MNADDYDHVCYLDSICVFSSCWKGMDNVDPFVVFRLHCYSHPFSLDETSLDGLMDYSTLGMAFDIIHPGASHDSPRSSVLQSRTSCIRVDRTTATSPVAGSKYSSAEDRRSDG